MKKYLLAILSVMLIAKAEEVTTTEPTTVEEKGGQTFADFKPLLEKEIADAQNSGKCDCVIDCYKTLLEKLEKDSDTYRRTHEERAYQNFNQESKQETQKVLIAIAKLLCSEKEGKEMIVKLPNEQVIRKLGENIVDNPNLFGEVTNKMFSNPQLISTFRAETIKFEKERYDF